MYTVIGVAKDMRYITWGMRGAPQPMFYVPEAQMATYDDPGAIPDESAGSGVASSQGSSRNRPRSCSLQRRFLSVPVESRFRTTENNLDPDLVIRRFGASVSRSVAVRGNG
jgi:hypothetical protein